MFRTLINACRRSLVSPMIPRHIPAARLQVEGLEDRQLLSGVPVFHSLPGAAASLYLDFNGHTQPASSWFYGGQTAQPFSMDADGSTFNADEVAAIKEIWQHVAEDFSPFKLNVTTVEPTGEADGRYLRIVFGVHNYSSEGGEAPIRSFLNGNQTDNMGLVQSGNVTSSNWRYLIPQKAATISHEAGHILGLAHTATSGDGIKEPIMWGGPYSRRVWWLETVNGTVYDDIAKIASSINGFGFRRDEAGTGFGNAVSLRPATGSTTARVSGVIATTADKDYYTFETTGGPATLKVGVAHSENETTGFEMLAANLDAKLELYQETANGPVLVPIDGDPTGSLEIQVTKTLTAGRYYLVVQSHGGRGDAGQYTLEVTAPFATGILDNGTAGYSETGTGWKTVTGGYGGTIRTHVPGTASAQWRKNGLGAGRYEVQVTWVAGAGRASNATYKIYDGSTLRGTVMVNQTQSPRGTKVGAATFQSLGKFKVNSGTLRVVLEAQGANGVVVADGVRLLAGQALIDDSAAGFSKTGTWYPSLPGNGYGGSLWNGEPGDGSSTATWQADGLAAGTYNVRVTWLAWENRASNAGFRIYDGTRLLATIRVNQKSAPVGVVVGGSTFQSLGKFSILSGQLRVVLANDADGYVIADAMQATLV